MQARRYDAGADRFVSEDVVKGHVALPHTLNSYTYCWNRPLEHVDLDGRIAWEVVALIALGIGVAMGLTGCGTEKQDTSSITYIPIYDCKKYNSDKYIINTNCYAYAFGMLNNPITGKKFPEGGNQPGLLSEDEYYLDYVKRGNKRDYYERYLAGTEESNKNLVNVVKADMETVGINFAEYEEGMEGGKRVALVVNPYNDYHWYVYDEITGTWYNKNGRYYATNEELMIVDGKGLEYGDVITDYEHAASLLGYSTVGEYYITWKDGSCFE